MGDHRAAPRSSRATWVRVLLTLTGVFLLVVVVLKVVVDRNETGASADPGPGVPGATSTPSTPVKPSPSASPKASREPSKSAGAILPLLDPASATRIEIDDLVDTGFDAVVSPADGRLSPLSRDEVARWGERGLPGNPVTDTVVVVGSTRDATASLWGLEQVRRGATITLTTSTGRLGYSVDSIRTISSTAGGTDPLMTAQVPGRLILLGARYDSAGVRADSDLVLVATLSRVETS